MNALDDGLDEEILARGREVLRAEGEAVLVATDLLDRAFCRSVRILEGCTGSVVVTGIGKAGLVARKISATLASTGTPSHFLHPAEAMHGDLGALRATMWCLPFRSRARPRRSRDSCPTLPPARCRSWPSPPGPKARSAGLRRW